MKELDQLTPDHAIWQLVGNAAQLTDGGMGLRFEVQSGAATLPAFVVQYDGSPAAFLNQCAHVAMEMDWQHGQFFDLDQRFLMCATHGALYEPDTGVCVAGPCTGAQLTPIPLQLQHGQLYAAQRI